MGDPQPERRKAPRKRTLKSACVVFNDRHSVIDCTVRNLSANGALLLLPSIVGVPNEFEVCIDGTYHSHTSPGNPTRALVLLGLTDFGWIDGDPAGGKMAARGHSLFAQGTGPIQPAQQRAGY